LRGLAGAVLVLLVFGGCSDHGDPTAAESLPVNSGPVSYSADIQPIFDTQCIGCHGAAGNAGLDLRSGQSHANLVAVDAVNSSGQLVVAGDSAASVIQQRLTGTGASFMPPAGPLQVSSLDLVAEWINDGALDN